MASFCCKGQQHSKQQATEKVALNQTNVGVRKTNGKWFLNEEVILKNQNLDRLLSRLEQTPLTNYRTPTALPPFLKSFLKELLKEDFSLAGLGENWQSGCVILEDLPTRQMTYLGLSNGLAVMSYKTGGIGVSQHVLILQFKGQQVTDLWIGVMLKDLTTKEAIVRFIKENRNKKWGLNTDVVNL